MTTTDTADYSTLKLDVPEGVQTVTITRDFAAGPDKVFRAHVDPELFVKWCGPDTITNTIREWNPTTGGNWSYVASDDNGEYGFFGSFHEVRENERIVQTFTFEGFPDAVNLEILTLTALGDGRTRLTSTSAFDSLESRDGMVASRMEHGIVEGYNKLDRLLADG
ncbi:SRPBCC family protein [Brevibacterium renqingii]|uniref:SRPBCC family protein n=1 Tax=Brevibacterium renqingii TaxID=2776916 RepID=UPI001ADED089|nr:SRPBCC family protein [Brevibacterium renqingii]